MCGIAGRFNYLTGAPVAAETMAAMSGLLAHRGPDGSGVFVDGPVGLAHRRLAVIDLSPGGRQPMATDDGRLWITFNGEIYNFLGLRAELESHGHQFRSQSDTEVILAAYRQYGVDCLAHLRGMFAFAIWDRDTRRLFAARDRLGKKPLHYRLDHDGLTFASEPKAFLAEPGFSPQVDMRALSQYLTWQFVPSPLSAFKDVSKLPPAHYLLVDDCGVKVRRYWRLRYGPKQRTSEAEATEQIMARLREAVRLRLISDVPLGAFLSGGVDSSVIVALMAEAGGAPVKTFSIGFEESEYNELRYARQVAERYGTDHHEFVVRPEAADVLPRLAWHYNEPYADESAIPTYYLAQMTRRHVTVALNGDAGDENFAGYRRYRASRSGAWFAALPAPARTLLTAATRNASWLPDHPLILRTRMWFDDVVAPPERRYASRLMHFRQALKTAVCSPEFLEASEDDAPADLVVEAMRSSDGETFVERAMDADIQYYLPDCLLVKVDIATMAHALEGRSPLLDHQFMEFVATLPFDLKMRNGTQKYIFRQAARTILPNEVFARSKMGFGVPLDQWFRRDLLPMTRDLLFDGRLSARGYFRMTQVERLLDEHVRGVRAWHDQLFNLVMLELWHRTFLDERPTLSTAASGQAAATGLARS